MGVKVGERGTDGGREDEGEGGGRWVGGIVEVGVDWEDEEGSASVR